MNVWIKPFAVVSLLTCSAVLRTPAAAVPAASSAVAALPAPAQDALNSLAALPNSPLPSGTRLLSIRIVNGLATTDFSHELQDNFNGGDSGETRTVNAILRTLGQFPTVNRVQLLVEGKTIDSLGGLLTLSEPLPVLRPATDPAAQTPKRWLHRKMSASVLKIQTH